MGVGGFVGGVVWVYPFYAGGTGAVVGGNMSGNWRGGLERVAMYWMFQLC